jgi:predicted metalloendopeptidase
MFRQPSPAAWAPALLATALAWAPLSLVPAQTVSHPAPSALERGVDPGIRPGDDFFAYANGAWLKATAIPAGRERWTARHEIDDLTRGRVLKLLDQAAAEPAGSTPRKVADFRAAWLNEAAIEARGLAPLRPLLDSIDRVEDKGGLTRLLGRGVRADVDPMSWGIFQSSHLLGLSVEQSIHGEKTFVAFLLQGGLGLPDRQHYLSTDSAMQALRTRYQHYLGRLLALAGADRPQQRAEAVMALETAIARSHATPEASANDRNADSVWTRADFARRAPGMDWSAFFAAAGLSAQESFVAWQPTAMAGAAALVASQPLETWKDYLRVRVLDRYADVLPRAFAEPALALHGTAAPREQRAREATQLALSDALGRMYVERYFPAEQKARVETIVANVVTALIRRVEGATWMAPGTKALALTKLKALYIGIGYPDQWQDYSGLAVDAGDAFGNLRRVEDWKYRQTLARLGRPVDRTEWWIPPQMPGAILLFQQNAYDFSAALLQPPKFDPTASDAASYGAIGAIIGHDASHFIDLLGAEYEADGRERRWWTPEDLSRFELLTEPLVNQFSGYHPLPDLAVNGKLARSENIADLAGLAAAFDAYRSTLGDRVTDRDYVRRQDREFFLGFAQSWRSKASEAGMRKQIATDIHAPDNYRIATVRNLDAWYDAFDVKPGQRLYLEPGARVRIW